MQRDLRAYLWEIMEAVREIEEFTSGKGLDNYLQDAMLRAAVERKFEIIGEALSQMNRHFPESGASVQDYHRIVAFRNRLIHGYANVSDALVWDIVRAGVPVLKQDIQQMLEKLDQR